MIRICQSMQEIQVQSLGREDPLEEEMATLSRILAWEIPWTEKPGREIPLGHESRTRLSDWACPHCLSTLTMRWTLAWLDWLHPFRGHFPENDPSYCKPEHVGRSWKGMINRLKFTEVRIWEILQCMFGSFLPSSSGRPLRDGFVLQRALQRQSH